LTKQKKLAEKYKDVYGTSALRVACADFLEGSLTFKEVLVILAS
jgi:hypothetical protein